MSNYDLYLKKAREKYKNSVINNSIDISDEELDAQASRRASILDATNTRLNSLRTRNNQALENTPNPEIQTEEVSKIAQENQIAWSNEYEEESLNWWERMGAWIIQAKNTLAKTFLKMGTESLVDAGALVGAMFADWTGNKEASENINNFIKMDLTGDLVFNQEWYRESDKFLTGIGIFGDKASKFAYNDKATQDWVKKMSQGIGSALGFSALTSIPYVGWGLAAMSVGGAGAEEALQDGANAEQAFAYGLGSAAVETATELFVGKLLNMVGKGGSKLVNKLLGTNFGGKAANDVVGGIGKQYGKSILLNLAKNFNEEGFEEVVSDVMTPILKQIYKECDSNNFFEKYGELWEEQGGWNGLLESYFYGGMSAGIMGGVGVATRIAKYGSVKAVQFENSVAQIAELDEEIKKEIAKTDVSMYENVEDNPKVAYLLKQKEYLQNKIANDFKEWLDMVKADYDTAYESAVSQIEASGDTSVTPESLINKRTKLKGDLAEVGQQRISKGTTDLIHEVGSDIVNKMGYNYVGTDNVSKSDPGTRTIYVNGKTTFREYVKTLTHETEHVANLDGKGQTKGLKSLTNAIIDGMSNKAYEEEFSKQLLKTRQIDHFLESEAGKEWLAQNKLSVESYNNLSDSEKLELIKKSKEATEWFNEEVAAEHLIDSITSLNKLNKLIENLDSRGIRKLLYTIRSAFGNSKDKPKNYNEIIKALEDGIKKARTNALNEIKTESETRNREKVDLTNKKADNRNIESEEIENDFRRIQEESRRITKEEQQLYWRGNKILNVRTQRLLSKIFGRWIESRSSEYRYGNELHLKSKYGVDFAFYQNVDADTFHDVFEIARTYLLNGELVTLHNVESTEYEIGYKDTQNYISKDGMQGFAITKDGDLISVYNLDKKKRGFLSAIKPIVIENTKTLDCFMSPHQPLNVIYKTILGFETASIMDYNMEYDTDNIAKNHNMPQVAFMVNNTNVETKYFDKDSYDEAKQWQLDNVKEKETRFRETETKETKKLNIEEKDFTDEDRKDYVNFISEDDVVTEIQRLIFEKNVDIDDLDEATDRLVYAIDDAITELEDIDNLSQDEAYEQYNLLLNYTRYLFSLSNRLGKVKNASRLSIAQFTEELDAKGNPMRLNVALYKRAIKMLKQVANKVVKPTIETNVAKPKDEEIETENTRIRKAYDKQRQKFRNLVSENEILSKAFANVEEDKKMIRKFIRNYDNRSYVKNPSERIAKIKQINGLIETFKNELANVKYENFTNDEILEQYTRELFGGAITSINRQIKFNNIVRAYQDLINVSNETEVEQAANDIQPTTTNVENTRTVILTSYKKIAMPEIAGIKAQADLKIKGKVYTLESTNNLIKLVNSYISTDELKDYNFKLMFEDSTYEFESTKINMILNEYTNAQYVKGANKIDYSNLTYEQKVDKITDILVDGITFDYDANDDITNDKLSDYVSANDELAIEIKEYIKAQVSNLITNEGNPSKISRVLDAQARLFNKRIERLVKKVDTLTKSIVKIKAQLREARMNSDERKIKSLTRKLENYANEIKARGNKIRKLHTELRRAYKKIDFLYEQNANLKEVNNTLKQKNTELYTDLHGTYRITTNFQNQLVELGRNINPDFKLSPYVNNKIAIALSQGHIDTALDYFTNALMNSDYVDDGELIKFSEIINEYEAIYESVYKENGETKTQLQEDLENIRLGFEQLLSGQPLSTKYKFQERLARMKAYATMLRMRLTSETNAFRRFKRAVLVKNTATRLYNKIISNIEGLSKSDVRTGGVYHEIVEAMITFVKGSEIKGVKYKALNKMTPQEILDRQFVVPLTNLRNTWNKLYKENLINTQLSIELNQLIDMLIDEDAIVNVGYLQNYQKVLNGINRAFEEEVKLRNAKMGDYNMPLAELSQIAQDQNWLKANEKKEAFHFTQNFLTPNAVFLKMARFNKKSVVYQIYQELFDSEMKKESVELDLRSYFNEFEKNKGANKFYKELGTEYTINGLKAKKGQLLSFYEAFKREQSRAHIENKFGGIEVDGIVSQFRNEDGSVDIDAIEKLNEAIAKEFNLNDENSLDYKFIQAVEGFFRRARYYKYNVDIIRWGFSNIEDGFYFPISIADSDAQQNISSDAFFNTEMPGAANYSWNRNTIGTMGAIKLNNILDVVQRHLNQMSTYAGYAVAVDNIKKLWNYKLKGGKTFAQAVKSRYDNESGIKLQKYIATLVNDVQGIGGKQSNNVDNLFYKVTKFLRGATARVALGANPKVMFSQVASIPAAMKYIKARYLMRALRSGFGVGFGNGTLPAKPDMLIYRKQSSQIALAETSGILGNVEQAIDKTSSIFSKGIEAFDTYAINVIWKASLLQTRNSDNSWNIEAATKLAQQTIFDTQPNYIALGRSEFLRSRNDLARLFTMFQSQAQQNLSTAYIAIERVIYKLQHKMTITSDDKEELFKSLVSLLVQALLYSGVGELFKHLVNNDWQDINAQDEAVNFGVDFFNDNILGMIPIFNMFELDLSKTYKISANNLRAGFLENYVELIQNILEGKGNPKQWVDTLGQIFGIPTNNLYKWNKALLQYIPSMQDFVTNVDLAYKGKELSKASITNAYTPTLQRTYYKKYMKDNSNNTLTDETIKVMYELYKKGYKNSIIKEIPNTITINGQTVKINSSEFLEVYGKLGNVLNKIVNTRRFGALNSEYQEKVLNKLINLYYSASKKYISGEDMNILELLVYYNKTIDFDTLMAIIKASELEATERQTKKEVVTKFINKQRLTAANKYFIYKALGYSVDRTYYQAYLIRNLNLNRTQLRSFN